MLIKDQLKEELSSVIKVLGGLPAGQQGDFMPSVEIPADLEHGDFTTNSAMILGKILKKNPMEVGEEIKSKFQISNFSAKGGSDSGGKFPISNNNIQIIEKIEVVRPGFVNFWLSKDHLVMRIDSLLNSKEYFDRESNLLLSKKIMIEYAHPNTHKALHIGHIRNITTGESLVRLMESQGAQVIRANYQGDVGMHIAKALYALINISSYSGQLDKITGKVERVQFLGKAYAAGSQEFETDPQAKDKIRDYNYLIYAAAQRLQQEKGIAVGTTDYLQFVEGRKEDLDKVYLIWKETRQWSLDYYEEMYKIFNTHFNRYFFESECLSGVDLAKDAVKKGVLTESEGAIIFNGEKFGLDKRVFVNSLGLPTYEAKELALAEKEFTEFFPLDKAIHIVGPEQSSFFKVTFKAEELLDPEKYKDKQIHLAYGWVRLKHGKMSSRLGNVFTAEQLLKEAKAEIQAILEKSDYSSEEREKIVERVAVAAIKYSFLKVAIHQEIAFDLQESISFDGNSGPYLQYTYARTQSVLRKAGISNFQFPNSNFKLEKEELELLRVLVRFEDAVRSAAERYAPNILCNYLFGLAQVFNLFYQKLPILKAEGEVKDLRLALTEATGKVIERGLYLLGIEAPGRM